MWSFRSLGASALLAALLASLPAAAAPAAPLRLPGGAELRIRGTQGGDFAVASAGDFDGDGLDDVIVGVPSADPYGRRDAGSAFVVLARRGGSRVVDLRRPGDRVLRIDGRSPAIPVEDEGGLIGERAGTAVAGVGDANGDGLDDVAIGAPEATPDEDRALAGAVHVVFGRRTTGTLDLDALGGGGYRIDGAQRAGRFGERLAGLAGREPWMAVADVGIVQLLRLAPGGAEAVHTITGYDLGDFNPFYASYELRSLASAGDVDGDGLGDLLIGQGQTDVEGVEPDESSYESTAFVVFGGGPAALPRLGARGLRIDDVSGGVAAAGNLLGDRRADVLVAGTRGVAAFPRFPEGGGPVVVAGRAGARIGVANGGRRAPGVRRVPAPASAAIAALGDLDGDGRPEIALASSSHEGAIAATLRIVSSRAIGRRRARPLRRATAGRSRVGRHLVPAGDADGDGRADLLVSMGREVLVVTAAALRRAGR